ncbi:MAG: hypothetical protein AB2A00_14790 [Myxococcota bacterium]
MIKQLARRMLRPVLMRVEDYVTRKATLWTSTSPETKAIQRNLFHYYRDVTQAGRAIPLAETGFRVFSQFEEDGVLLYIFAALGVARGTFVDVGSADGIRSNCANLALNLGWDGVFIDGNPENIRRGEAFYRSHPDTCEHPPRFLHAMVSRENINDILTGAGVPHDVDFMSVDIDGNDYWVWDAITAISPKVVMVETHVEFGLRDIVVPYDPSHVYPGKHPDYFGASPTAMARLAAQKGYRLVGANNYGFNTIYVRQGLAETALPEVTVESILQHPRNAERLLRFEPIKDWPYVSA